MLERRHECEAVVIAAGGGGEDRFHVRLLQSQVGRAYGLSLTLGHRAAATPWGGADCAAAQG